MALINNGSPRVIWLLLATPAEMVTSTPLWARERVPDGAFIEVFVDASVEECRRRDPKGLYKKADAGLLRGFTGVDAPYEAPDAPELHLRTAEASPEELAEHVVAELRRRGVFA